MRRVAFSQSLKRCLVGHLRCAALDDEVEAGKRHGERAARIRSEVPALLGVRAACEVELAVNPKGAHTRQMRAAIRPDSAQPCRPRRLRRWVCLE